jgi:hypothetical protein
VTTSKIPTIGSLIGDSTLAGTYYYQDQTSPSVLKGPPSSITLVNLPSTATQVCTTRGPINLGQIRYGFGTGSNVSFPICFTYANRSELITHPIKGLQFGLNYKLSSLFTNSSKVAQEVLTHPRHNRAPSCSLLTEDPHGNLDSRTAIFRNLGRTRF